MIFDLKGRRRRVVQVTYVGLAMLMGGGLVLTGVGSSANGGLLDALIGKDSSSSDDAKEPLQKRVDAAEARLTRSPKDRGALGELVRAHFALASLEEPDDKTGEPTAAAQRQAAEAEQAWGRYIDTDPPRTDQGLASTAIAIYDSGIVPLPTDQKQKNARYVQPATELADQANTKDAYIRLVQVATKAGDTRTADLAGRKALSFAATKDDRMSIKTQIDDIKASAAASAGAGGGATTVPPTGTP